MLSSMQRTTATKMAISEEVLAQRLADLSQLLPNLVSKMAIMGPDNIAKLAADPSSVALKLVQLKGIFPEADTPRMVAHKMGLILHDNLDDIAAAAGNPYGPNVMAAQLQSLELHGLQLVCSCRGTERYPDKCQRGQVSSYLND